MSNWICPNCRASHSCSCAARNKNGIKGCVSCIGSIASKIHVLTDNTPRTQIGAQDPVITKIALRFD